MTDPYMDHMAFKGLIYISYKSQVKRKYHRAKKILITKIHIFKGGE